MGYFGRVTGIRQKGELASVVCDADLASEESILRGIRRQYPDDGIIAEESGFQPSSSGYTWVIDPLDGTSNFVVGLPWFGVLLARVGQGRLQSAAMYVPIEKALFVAEAGGGVYRNGTAVAVTRETNLKKILCAFGLDGTADLKRSRRQAEFSRRVSQAVRNLRATNSLLDFCYTLEGKLGAFANLGAYIWDIAPVCLMVPEAGGIISDLSGRPIKLDLGRKAASIRYQVLGASRALHPKLVKTLCAPAA